MAEMIYKRDGLRFEWSGGSYINIYVGDDESPIDLYNVWDYAENLPLIQRSMAGLTAYVDSKMDTAFDLAEAILNNR